MNNLLNVILLRPPKISRYEGHMETKEAEGLGEAEFHMKSLQDVPSS